MGRDVDETSFIVGYFLGRRHAGDDPLAIAPGAPSTTPWSWRLVAATLAIGVSLAGALLWFDLTTGVGWLRTVVLALVTTGVAVWLAETRWERRVRATTVEREPSAPDDAG